MQLSEARVPDLIEALNDESPEVRRTAAERLGELRAPEAVEPLIGLLGREVVRLIRDDDRVWLAALDALQFVGEPSVVPLIELVADSENNQELRHEAVETLVNIGDNRALPALINALADEDSLIRSDSAWALGEFRSVQAVEPLLLALRDEDIDVRYEAAKSLGQIGDKRAVEPLIKALEDETEVRQAAAEALGKLGDSRAIPALLLSEQRETARLHKNRDAKESAAQAIKEILSRKQDTDSALVPWQLSLTTDDVKYGLAVAPFIDALNDNDPTTRRSAASALGQLRDWRAIEPLLDALKSDDPDLRYNAAEALGNLGDERAVFALAWIKDNDLALTLSGKRVRDAATQALETINAAKDFNDPTE